MIVTMSCNYTEDQCVGYYRTTSDKKSDQDRIKERLLNIKFKLDRIDLNAYTNLIQIKMHEDPHNSNCQCDACHEKLGNLPVLLEGIEKSTQPQPSTSGITKSNRKTMTCPHCDKLFNHKGDLRKHLRMHSGEKPYTCEVCDKRFSHTSNLKRHLRVHSGDRPFHCENCGKDFSRKDKLEMHKQTKICKKRSLNATKTE